MENELVIFNKYIIIENCMKRIYSIFDGNFANLDELDKQDIIILNFQRASQATMDIAKYVVSLRKLDKMQNSNDTFLILKINKIISEEVEQVMQKMIQFRNDILYNWESLDLKKFRIFLDEHLGDLREFARAILNLKRGE